jgi:FecR protein
VAREVQTVGGSPDRTLLEDAVKFVPLVKTAAAMLLTLGWGAPLLAQANEADGYGDGYQSGAYGRVRVAEGGATIVRADTEGGEPDRADVNAPLFPGDLLRTDRSQRVEVQLSGGTVVRMDRGAEVVFQSLPNPSAKYQDNTVLAVNGGVVRIRSRLADKEEFRVDTRDASIYLLGEGEYRIDASDPGGTRVASLRGVAEVVGNEASVLVRGGMRTVTKSGSSPDVPKSYSAFASDGFDRWCDAREDSYRAHDPDATRDDEARADVPEEVRPYYSELSQNGSWSEVPDYGTVWSPNSVATGWRPYTDGYWTYGPGGYFWVSSEPWGWAPYHYGNWQWVGHHGWCWVPGRVFAGAWVSWSFGSLYVGWAPLDFWGRPGWIGGPFVNGFYDPGCWTFVNYDHVNARDVHRYAVPIGTVHDDLHGATVVSRAPRVDPRRFAGTAEWRDRALRQASDDHAAQMRPIDTARRPDRRLSDLQDHLMKRPSAATPAPSFDRRTAPPRARRILEDPRTDARREARPETQNDVRDLYQRMSRPRETRGQLVQAPTYEIPSYRTRQQPHVEAPHGFSPPALAPRPQAPPVHAPQLEPPRAHGAPEAKPKHGEKH